MLRRSRGWSWFLIVFVIGPVLLITALYIGLLFIAHDGNPDFFAIDACLDRGGRWDYEKRVCESGPDH